MEVFTIYIYLLKGNIATMISNIIMRIAFLLPTLVQVESNGDWDAIGGDYNSFGGLQITQVMVDDLNRINPESTYTINDAYSPEKAPEMCKEYLLYYGIKYYNNTGKIPDYEQLARIWNGGPNGWSRHCTLPYWEKVNMQMSRY